MKLNHRCFAFYGQITNRDSVIEALGLVEETSMQDLLTVAFQTWKLDFNQKVLGDYALVLPLGASLGSSLDAPIGVSLDSNALHECFISCSAFSSFSLFYQATNLDFSVSFQLDDFLGDALLDPAAIGQLFTQSYIVPPLTLVKDVRQLSNGESQLWQISSKTIGLKASCLVHKTLTLMEKIKTGALVCLPEEKRFANTQVLSEKSLSAGSVDDNALKQLKDTGFDAFMALPSLSRILNEPVTQVSQLTLVETLLNQEGESYVSASGMSVLGLVTQGQGVTPACSTGLLNQRWDKTALDENKTLKTLYKRIFKSNMRQAFKAQRQVQLKLRQEYQSQMLSFKSLDQTALASAKCELPSFETWLQLSVCLPNVWRQERLIAESLGKTIYFSCLDASLIRHSLGQIGQTKVSSGLACAQLGQTQTQAFKTDSPANYFKLDDDSLVNLYDAMQRLMMHGYQPVTKTLFKIVPPITAKLIKQHKHGQRVQAFCMKSLTLDHLSRHLNCSLARS